MSSGRSLYVFDSAPRMHQPTKFVRLKREGEELQLNSGTVGGHVTHTQPTRLSVGLSD